VHAPVGRARSAVARGSGNVFANELAVVRSSSVRDDQTRSRRLDEVMAPRIKPGVYFALALGEGVVMDVVDNRYYGLTQLSAEIWKGLERGQDTAMIARTLAGSKDMPDVSAVSVEELCAVVDEQVRVWRAAGLVVPEDLGTSGGPPLRSRPAGRPASRELDGACLRAARLSMRNLARLWVATRWLQHALRRQGLIAVLRRFQSSGRAGRDPRGAMDEIVYPMVRAYSVIRRPFAQGNSDCFERSLALGFALRDRGVSTELCVGVEKFPFFAHAWLEREGIALNDRVENIRTQTVIARF